MDFNIDEQYLTDVIIHDDYMTHSREVTPEKLFDIIKGKNRITITRSENHPIFEDLRQQLAHQGYIKIENRWVNGDVVTEPFTLNGMLFEKGQKFCCASALGISMSVRRKYNI